VIFYLPLEETGVIKVEKYCWRWYHMH